MADSNYQNENSNNIEVEILIEKYENGIQEDQNLYLEQYSFLKIIEYYEDKIDIDKALDAAELAQLHYPFSAIFKIKAAKYLHEIGETQTALEELDQAYMLDATETEYFLTKSEILASLGKFDEAIDIIQDGLSFADKLEKFDLLLNLSDIYESKLNYRGMFDTLCKAAMIYPTDFEVADRIAFAAEELQCYAEAIEIYNRILDIEPYAPFVWNNLGKTYNELHLHEKAIEAFDFALAINESYYEAQFEKAETYYALNNYHKALDNYLEATKLKEADEELYYCLGFTYYHLNNHSLAIRNFKNAIKVDPKYADAYFQLAKIKEEHGFDETALHYYEKAISLDTYNNEFQKGIADFFFKQEKYNLASKHYISFLTIDPSFESIWLKLSHCYANLDLYEEALQVIEFGINANEHAPMLLASAGIYCWQSGKQQAALDYFRDALILDGKVVLVILDELPFLKENPQIQHLISQYL